MRPFWALAAAVGAFSWWLWFSTASFFLASFFHVRAWSAPFWIVAVVALMPGAAAAVLPGLVAALAGPVGRDTLGWAVLLLVALAAVSFVAGGIWLLPPAALYLSARHRVDIRP